MDGFFSDVAEEDKLALQPSSNGNKSRLNAISLHSTTVACSSEEESLD
jgi:hypothetical protein